MYIHCGYPVPLYTIYKIIFLFFFNIKINTKTKTTCSGMFLNLKCIINTGIY